MQKEPRRALFPDIRPTLGCDPELFIRRPDGAVVGSERAIDIDKGLKAAGGKIICDGVQVELNPSASTCRESLAYNIRGNMHSLKAHLAAKGYKADFSCTVEVPKEELGELSPRSRTFGCAPSLSAARPDEGAGKIKAELAERGTRSAGGHVHMGYSHSKRHGNWPGTDSMWKDFQHDCDKIGCENVCMQQYCKDNPVLLVNVLDLVLGNTCVMLDRDPGNAERRKVYGKAGEYRLPKHGIEYRTLSNFWLRSYALMSFVFGTARFCVSLVQASDPSLKGRNFAEELLSCVSMDDVRQAIDENDAELASRNFAAIRTLLIEFSGDSSVSEFPFTYKRVLALEKLIKEGIEKRFPHDPMTYWTEVFTDVKEMGAWETYADKRAPRPSAAARRISEVLTGIVG